MDLCQRLCFCCYRRGYEPIPSDFPQQSSCAVSDRQTDALPTEKRRDEVQQDEGEAASVTTPQTEVQQDEGEAASVTTPQTEVIRKRTLRTSTTSEVDDVTLSKHGVTMSLPSDDVFLGDSECSDSCAEEDVVYSENPSTERQHPQQTLMGPEFNYIDKLQEDLTTTADESDGRVESPAIQVTQVVKSSDDDFSTFATVGSPSDAREVRGSPDGAEDKSCAVGCAEQTTGPTPCAYEKDDNQHTEFTACKIDLAAKARICELIDSNTGEHDARVLTWLESLSGCDHPDDRAALDELVLRVICSPRRYLKRGEMFMLESMSASRAWSWATNVQSILGNRLILNEHTCCEDDATVIGEFLGHVTRPLDIVSLRGDLGAAWRHLLSAPRGLCCLAMTSKKLAELGVTARNLVPDSTLTSLALTNPQVVMGGVLQIDPPRSIRSLHLRDAKLKAEDVITLCRALLQFPQIDSLELVSSEIGQALRHGESTLGHLRQLQLLNNLMLYHCELNHTDMKALFANGGVLLEYINLGENPLIGDEGISYLSRHLASDHCTVRSLSLSNCGLSGEGAAALFQTLFCNTTVTCLNISNNNIKNIIGTQCRLGATAAKIALKSCKLTARAAARLLDGNKCTYINLSRNKLDKRASELTSVLFRGDTLRCLQLCMCHLTDSFLKELTDWMKGGGSLTAVDVSSNTALSADAILDLCSCRGFSQLCVTKCLLSASDWQRVGKAVSDNTTLDLVFLGDENVCMLLCVAAIDRIMKRVYVLSDVIGREQLARCASGREQRLGVAGMFVLYNSASVGYGNMWREAMYSTLPEHARNMLMSHPLWDTE